MESNILVAVLVVHTVLISVVLVLLMLTVRQVGILNLRIGPVGSRTLVDGPEVNSDQSENPFVRTILASHLGNRHTNFLFTFISPNCGGCKVLYPALRTIAGEQHERLLVVAVASSLSIEQQSDLKALLGAKVAVAQSDQLFGEWKISGTPYCVLLDKQMQVMAKGVTNTIEHLDSLLNALELGVPTMEEYLTRHNSIRLAEHERGVIGQ